MSLAEPAAARPAADPAPRGAPGLPRRALAAAALLALAGAARLALAWGEVPNRASLGWDAARRAVLNLEAAQALRELRPLTLLRLLAGPETWPTLRMALAAPLLAVTGPSFAVEGLLSCAFSGALLGATFLLAAALAPARPLLAGAAAAALVAAHEGLLGYAATPMLEPLSALLTTVALLAWVRLRDGGAGARLWPLALAGNLLFHAKWQHGIFLALAALAVEVAGLDGAARASAARALLTALRRRAFAAFAAAALACALAAAVVAATGGVEATVLGLHVIARTADGPVFWAAFALLAGGGLELWRSRALLRREVPRRLRGLVVWLALPMAAWTLVPFTWRLRTMLVTSTTFEPGGAARLGPLGGLAFHARAVVEGFGGPARAGLLLGLGAAAAGAALRPELRRRLAPVAALAAVELAALGLGTRANYQARFSLNLAPALAAAAPAALSLLPPLAGRAAGVGLLALALAGAAPRWRAPRLEALLSPGFNLEEIGAGCAAVARAVPPAGGFLVNETAVPWRQDCALAFFAEARRRGAPYDAERDRPAPADREAIQVGHDCSRTPPALAGFRPDGPAALDRGVCARRYRR
ncbi:hypothetical protein [Anaeromyxobacter paludicola]|uniref:Glycosyltransferase RgtA/B/C/D-like domain-containing protein n=1 Tax=Anaeromyxobacter paludicola TaxID=2918171 RepID=A0ABN6NC41_9BACT|nr:hypothetical protein [Anaeromyxobacter paludicola]BDG09517.1 hypothetical protein AMPC_26300 [Anaeromyxobacter paludicola]